MQVLTPSVDLDAFYATLSGASERILMLDYDGTLAPFKIRPEQAVPYPGVVELLDAVMAQDDTRVVIVSGRRTSEVAALLSSQRSPEIWGAHGWERMFTDGVVRVQETAEELRQSLSSAEASAEGFRRVGARIECKPASVALHWRGLPAIKIARLREQVRSAWEPFAADGLLELIAFDGGLELRARGTNKEHAVRTVLAESGAACVAAYLGDDITDEDAFRAIKGHGLAVLVRSEPRETLADLWLRPPRELIVFLRHWRHPVVKVARRAGA
ncbi:MAG: trehalose-phosphatase [Betaproteobacteria bacterium]|nr:trehalose-phosphatase [Betaproteobacteria bacterium]MDH3438082.1 trehalose-phosphatase [Betaproteobacteria bacterium]